MKKSYKAFSLVEVSIVLLIISLIIAAITLGNSLSQKSKISTARSLTENSPVAEIPNLISWFETTRDGSVISATNGNNPDNNDAISDWININPQLTTSFALSQATSNLQPSYIQNSINGLPAIKFDGTNDYFSGLNSMGQSFSLFVVLKTASPGTGAIGDEGWATTSIINSDVAFTANDIMPLTIGAGKLKFFTGDSNSTLTSATSVNNNAPHIANVIRDITAGTKTIFIDGINDATGSGGQKLLLDNPVIEVGGNSLDVKYYDGFLGEIIIYNRNLNTEERKAVENYLGKKWGVKTPQ